MQPTKVVPWPVPPQGFLGPEGGCSISGRVLDSAGRPARGAVIYLVPPECAGGDRAPWHEAHACGECDAEGAFRLRGLPAGPCAFGADHGDRLHHREAEDEAGRARTLAVGPRVVLDPRAAVEHVDIRLPFEATPFGGVEVRFTVPDGRSIEQLELELDPPAGLFQRPFFVGGSVFLSDALPEGPVRLRVLGRREFLPMELTFDVQAWATSHWTVELTRKPREGRNASLFSPGRVYSVTLHVEDEAGAPVEGATVIVGVPGEPPTARQVESKTGTDGTLRLEVPAGAGGPMVRAWRMPEYGRHIEWSHEDGARRTAEFHVVLEKHTRVRIRPVDAETGRPLESWEGTYRAKRPFALRPEAEERRRGARSRGHGGSDDGSIHGHPERPPGEWLPPGALDIEISVPGYETARIEAAIPRQDAPFELAVPMRRRA